ncbi:MAG TPA: GTA-gp10 family protein [Rhabdaerophilum sp.]|nr:GTA-gp10 family protein [Rhabdaerophilum sp.]
MSNRHRAEKAIEIGGRRLVLRLSLRALAEMESVFDVEGIEALGVRLARGGLRTEHVIHIVGALARGSGDAIPDSEIALLIEAQDLPGIMDAVTCVFASGFGGGKEPANPR